MMIRRIWDAYCRWRAAARERALRRAMAGFKRDTAWLRKRPLDAPGHDLMSFLAC